MISVKTYLEEYVRRDATHLHPKYTRELIMNSQEIGDSYLDMRCIFRRGKINQSSQNWMRRQHIIKPIKLLAELKFLYDKISINLRHISGVII